MIQLTITRTRSGSLTVIAETTLPSAPYVVPEVERVVLEFGSGESVSEVFQQLGEWCAGQLETPRAEPLGHTTSGEAVYVSDTERPPSPAGDGWHDDHKCGPDCPYPDPCTPETRPTVRQPCPEHGLDAFFENCAGCKRWYRRSDAPKASEPRVVEIPKASRYRTAVEVLRDPPTMLPRLGRNGKKPSERIRSMAAVIRDRELELGVRMVTVKSQFCLPELEAVIEYLDEQHERNGSR